MEASFSEMNWQQIVFVIIKLVFYAGMPFFIYMFMPALVIAVGTAIFTGSVKNLSESYSISAQNFYTFIGIICALIFIFRSAKRKEPLQAAPCFFIPSPFHHRRRSVCVPSSV